MTDLASEHIFNKFYPIYKIIRLVVNLKEVQVIRYSAIKKLGQNFLINREIAKAEAVHGEGRHVIELGPGPGMLTLELCKVAKSVIAIEKDSRLFSLLKSTVKSKKLTVLNKDFFDVTNKELMLGSDSIMISNIPYNLSSSVIEWLIKNNVEAILCLQKEFVDHMLAKEGTDKYSKLSVISRLSFSMTRIMNVGRGNFDPMPKVDSSIIYLKPKESTINDEDSNMINLLMQHKKKTVKSSLVDSHSYLHLDKRTLSNVGSRIKGGERRLFKMPPEEILEAAREINSMIKAST